LGWSRRRCRIPRRRCRACWGVRFRGYVGGDGKMEGMEGGKQWKGARKRG
jgi:nicotinamide mononucleotide (NMN) deamidase PncC